MATQINNDRRPRLARGVRLQIDCTTGKGVLLFPEGILELNETAQEILTRCDGGTVSEIAADLAKHYDFELSEIESDVRETLSELGQRKLIYFA